MLPLLAIGMLNAAIPFQMINWGQLHVTSGFAGISMAAVGLIVLPLAHVFIPGEKMTLRRFIGFAIGFASVVILIGDQAFVSTGSDLKWLGRLACFMTASCYACSAIDYRGALYQHYCRLTGRPTAFDGS
jgi:drug/metabolite transporter (DMT)-like permease